jgi:uncharacterized protein (DUF433 family)
MTTKPFRGAKPLSDSDIESARAVLARGGYGTWSYDQVLVTLEARQEHEERASETWLRLCRHIGREMRSDMSCSDDSDDIETVRESLIRTRAAAAAERQAHEARAIVCDVVHDDAGNVRLFVATPTGDRREERESLIAAFAAYQTLRAGAAQSLEHARLVAFLFGWLLGDDTPRARERGSVKAETFGLCCGCVIDVSANGTLHRTMCARCGGIEAIEGGNAPLPGLSTARLNPDPWTAETIAEALGWPIEDVEAVCAGRELDLDDALAWAIACGRPLSALFEGTFVVTREEPRLTLADEELDELIPSDGDRDLKPENVSPASNDDAPPERCPACGGGIATCGHGPGVEAPPRTPIDVDARARRLVGYLLEHRTVPGDPWSTMAIANELRTLQRDVERRSAWAEHIVARGVGVMRDRCGGHPTIAGTRLRTSKVAHEALRNGIAWCCDAWSLTREQVRAALEYEHGKAPCDECGRNVDADDDRCEACGREVRRVEW